MRYRVGIDIGGTFTDFIVINEKGEISEWKEDSTPEDPLAAIEKGLNTLSSQRGLSLSEFVGNIDGFVHGSTIATNALITRRGGPVGLICTKGFRDVLYLRDGFKWDQWDLHLPHPAPLVDRYLRLGVDERITVDGSVHRPLDEADVIRATERFRDAGVRAVAIALLWSVVNPAHEERVAEIVGEQLPDVYVIKSSDVLAETREWPRTSAAVLSAYVLPRIGDYLARFERFLSENGLRHPANYMQINGGVVSVDEVMRRPVILVHSGPAAAPSAATEYMNAIGSSQLDSGSGDAITVDMGGTSFDVCMIRNGEPERSRGTQVENQPVGVQAVEVASIGAGGGSIGWIDTGGALQVGPQSAGAVPGPACYAAGGEHPTVTDANVMLGYLNPASFLGGRRTLDAGLAEKALQTHVGDPLGLDPVQAARGIVQVVNVNMVGGIRSVSIERGIDPRSYLLVSAGGAGALHAARLARELEMSQVLFPAQASTFCALGMTVSDVKHDYQVAKHMTTSNMDFEGLSALFEELETEARDRLREDGFEDDEIELVRSADARYLAQIWELTVPIPSAAKYDASETEEFARRFHAAHEQKFTYALYNDEIEFLHWRVLAIGRSKKWARWDQDQGADALEGALIEERQAFFPESDAKISTPVYRIASLPVGIEVEGPAIFESDTTTMVINPGDQLEALAGGNLLAKVGQNR